jgi:glutaryl-CoA dehydrogenase
MKKFSGVDFMGLDNLFSEEELAVRQAVREFVDEEVMPIIAGHYEAGTFPSQLIPKMAELGIFGATLEGYGCAGVNNVAYGLLNQELERGDTGLRSFASVQSSLVMWPIFTYGSEEQKEKWLPRLARGEVIGCFGLTEPDHGSDPGSMSTRADRAEGGFRINGAKMWITNGSIADVAVIWAKLDGTVRGFLVEKGTPGFEAPKMLNKLSLRASVTSELVFNDCVIPEENLLPGAEGLATALRCLNQARFGICWGVIGSAMACYDEALSYAAERQQFDRPIAGFQLVQSKLVEMLNEITKAQFLTLQLGRLKDRGQLKHYQVSLAKYNNVSRALEIARSARTILGANGISLEYQTMRHACNLESVLTYEGTHDVHSLVVGAKITGIEAFR